MHIYVNGKQIKNEVLALQDSLLLRDRNLQNTDLPRLPSAAGEGEVAREQGRGAKGRGDSIPTFLACIVVSMFFGRLKIIFFFKD
jgi:hypothetical protein